MLDEVLELLAPALSQPGAIHVDGTLGMGGHAEAVLQADPQVRLIGIDRDPQALRLAGERLARFGERATLVHAVNDEIGEVLDDLGIGGVTSAFFDLGVSSLQLDETERGFAYAHDAPLDMRMDPTTGITAAEVLNTYDARELSRVLSEFGEERFARKIAGAIVREREAAPFDRSGRLVELLRATIPMASQRGGGHPAKRTFQALRIEVNQELAGWAAALPVALERLAVGGRLVVLSFHSLEDRITKRGLAAGATSSAPADLPIEPPEHAPELRLLTRGALTPGEQELATNPRSASVRLRGAERIRPPRRPKGTHR
ncbi:16S rRNA (cytosine(1402)-N(4))-methyltransferase RsmH [Janibacter terrae]|uniref:Ribosomal RNA small subunit methyltransferase H n=1 Tax=Janibacter terrae TaxID=103817 RepID=A0ABZ2FIE5_9MICO|nr:16S rRNA (cytosine(1402)-N(4))-methyltransferase RsmH [Janibacter terrae]